MKEDLVQTPSEQAESLSGHQSSGICEFCGEPIGELHFCGNTIITRTAPEDHSGILPEDIEEIIQWLSQGTYSADYDGANASLDGCLLIEEDDLRKILTKAYSHRWRGAQVTAPKPQDGV
jgi:hypothetical protein